MAKEVVHDHAQGVGVNGVVPRVTHQHFRNHICRGIFLGVSGHNAFDLSGQNEVAQHIVAFRGDEDVFRLDVHVERVFL